MMTINEFLVCFELGFIYGIIAIGIYFTFRILDFPDLTCDGSFVLGAASSVAIMKLGYNSYFCLIVSIVSGALSGLVTGILYTKFKITNLLSGILVAFMLYSINLRIMGNFPNISLGQFNTIFDQNNSIILLLVITIIAVSCAIFLLKTDFGLALIATGKNKKLSENYGINTKKMTVIGLMISNGLIAFGGALFSQNQSFVDIGSGIGTLIVSLASIVIGEKIFQSTSSTIQILSCVTGAIIYRLLIGIALHIDFLGLKSQDLNLITGIMIISIMYLSKKGIKNVET